MNLMGFFAPLIRPVLRRPMAMRISQFEQLPSQSGRIVFLGDSITEAGIWDEWFPDLPVLNRGVGGDSVGGVRARLATAIADPLAVSLLIGTNDLGGLGHSRDIGRIADQTRALVGDIQGRAPKATLLLNSVMPRRRSMAKAIRDLNERYAKIAAEAGVTYVDLWPVLADSDGAIRRNFTRDHLHLNGAGYEAWVGELRPLLAPFA
jgi:lysophospholipase L1-like esterase